MGRNHSLVWAFFLAVVPTCHAYDAQVKRTSAVGRRVALRSLGAFGSSAIGYGTAGIAPARALDPFQTPSKTLTDMTSKPLEFLRILEQEEADNIRYDGTLAGATPPTQPVLLLTPIARIEAQLRECRGAIVDPEGWEALRTRLTSPPFSKKEFKRTFNAYADNIYYSPESDRANAYLGGGATPSTQQTTQYMLRNEILGKVEIAAQELDYLIGLRDKGQTPRETLLGEELEDLKGFLDDAVKGMDTYLAIPDQNDVALARKAAATKAASVGWGQAAK